jgi:monoamine oxidase
MGRENEEPQQSDIYGQRATGGRDWRATRIAGIVLTPMTSRFDTIVIGAGLAGIAAAQHLSQRGQRVALVEARSRFGGRVWTRRDPATEYPIEMGPEWFNGSGPVHQLLAAPKLATPESGGAFLRRVHGELRSIDDPDDDWLELRARLGALTGPDRSLASALNECCGEPRFADAAESLRNYVAGFHGADPSQLSLHWLRQVEANQPAGAAELRAPGGLDQMVNAFLEQVGASCTVYLDTTVTGVRWRDGDVQVECVSGARRGVLSADAAVITLPLAVLRLPPGAGGVGFSPALASKRPAFAHLATGPVVKVILVFDAPFWKELPQLSDALFVQDISQPISTWWTTDPVSAPVLVGWAAGTQVERVGSLHAETLRRTALRSLSHVLDVPLERVSQRLRSWHWHNWQHDPLARGAYSWVRAGGVDAHKLLGAPLRDTLYFAGEATCGEGFNATMDGAVQSGERAARQLIDA